MHGAERAAEGQNPRIALPAVAAADFADIGHDLPAKIPHPLLVAADAPVGVAVRVRPGLAVDRIDGKDRRPPRLDKRSPGVDHAEVFKIEKAAVLAGDKQDGLAAAAVDLELHIPPQRGAVPFFIEYLHRVFLFPFPASPRSGAGGKGLFFFERCFSLARQRKKCNGGSARNGGFFAGGRQEDVFKVRLSLS